MDSPALILASTSPYRRALLERFGFLFETVDPGADETPLPGESPTALAMRLALAKAQAVAATYQQSVIIGADQVACLPTGEILGKPGTHERAAEQLMHMSGMTVQFLTAVSVVCHASSFQKSDMVRTRVTMRSLNVAEIDRYLQYEQPYDCAGSAKSEGLGITLMESIQSDDPTALIGLPLIATARLLRECGLELP